MSRAAKESDAAPREEQVTKRLQAGPLDLQALGLLEDGVALDLTGLLCHLLTLQDSEGKTWAQRIVEGWLFDALEGEPRAIEDILDRTEKGRLARASAIAVLPPIDEGTANKILEILCGRGDDATGD
jgi:hypothetical protein